ncbi:MAG: urease accessory UreF family protein, partial [Natronomonas sp.]
AVLAADERLHAATLPAEFRESSTKAGTGLLELLSDTDAGFGLPTTDGGAAGVGVPDAYSAADTADDGITTDDGITADYGAVVESGETPGHHAVALGVVCQASGIDREAACQVLAYTVVTDLLGAAQRLGRFGHTEIQTILSEQLPVIDELSTEYADADLAALGSFAPLADVMGMAHERADRRLFVS